MGAILAGARAHRAANSTRQAAGFRPPVVTCIAYRDGAAYRAVCLDLGLYAQGDSLQAASAELHALVRDYIDDAKASGRPGEFLPRQAPSRAYLHVYRKLAWLIARDLLRALLRRGPQRDEAQRFIHEVCAA